MLRVILPLFTCTQSVCCLGVKGIAWGRAWEQQELGWGLALLLFTASSPTPSPKIRRLPLGSGLTVTCTIPLPILNNAHPSPPPPRSRLGFENSRESLASVGAALEGAGSPLPYPCMPPGGGGVIPAHSGPGCRGSGSARPEAARPGVALACLLPCRLCRPHPVLPGGCSVTIIWPQGQVTPEPASSLCRS